MEQEDVPSNRGQAEYSSVNYATEGWSIDN